MNDRFVLEGITYFQQGRTCGHTECKCHQGELHGPYWYARDGMGTVKYIGKELPENIIHAHSERLRLESEIKNALSRLRDQSAALQSLLAGMRLDYAERMYIINLGFGSTLVLDKTQDSGG